MPGTLPPCGSGDDTFPREYHLQEVETLPTPARVRWFGLRDVHGAPMEVQKYTAGAVDFDSQWHFEAL